MIPKNLEPVFAKPKHHKARPAFLRACHTQLTKCPASSWDGWHLIQHVHGKSKVNVHAFNALDALCKAIVHHVDIESGVVQSNVTMLSDLCGLTTESKAGNVSISRASNAVKRLIKAGLLEGELVWDKGLGCWLPKFLNVTDLFWTVAHPEGIEGYNKAREIQYGFKNEGLCNDNEWLTVTQAKERRRLAHIKTAFELRKKKHAKSKERSKAKELADKANKKARSAIAKEILNDLDTTHGLTHEAFETMINMRQSLYRKMAADEPPPRH
jgi:hypothetical protein